MLERRHTIPGAAICGPLPKGRLLLFLAAVCVLGICALPTEAGTPVLTGCKLVGSSRGLMLVLTADGTFDLGTRGRNSGNGAAASVVALVANGVIYGIESASFSDFPKGCPVKSILVKEDTKARQIEIAVKVNRSLQGLPRAKQKGPVWMVLVSPDSVAEFTWDAAQATSAAIASASSTAPVAARPAAAPTTSPSVPIAPKTGIEPPTVAQKPSAVVPTVARTSQPVASSSSEAPRARLTDIRLLRRGAVEELVFVFDSAVHVVAKRQDTQMLMAFENAMSALTATDLALENSPTFVSVNIGAAQRVGTPWLRVTIGLNAQSGRSFAVVSEKSSIVISALVPAGDRLAVWSSTKGHQTAYDFVQTSSTSAGLEAIRSKAEKDSKRQLTEGETFALREPAPPPPPAAAPIATQPAVAAAPIAAQPAAATQPVAPEPPPVKKVEVPAPPTVAAQKKEIPAPAPSAERILLIVTKDNVNLRAQPATDAGTKVVALLAKGTEATQLESKGDWRKVQTSAGTGWIHRSLVENVNNAPASPSDERAGTQEQRSEQIMSALKDRAPAAAPQEEKPLVPPPSADTTAAVAQKPAAPEPIAYHGAGRDPFLPLLSQEDDSLGVPPVERLRLVGILYDESDRVALFEDSKVPGRAFALREADPIHDGKVLQIQENSVVFLVTEFDISRTATIRLSRDPGRSNGPSRPKGEEVVDGAGQAASSDGSASDAGGGQAIQPTGASANVQAPPTVSKLPTLPETQPKAIIRRRGGWASESSE